MYFKNITWLFHTPILGGAGCQEAASKRLSAEIGPNDLRLRNPARLESASVEEG
jgi:hypothetical protein